MSSKFIEQTYKEFLDYLMEYGFISGSTLGDFKKKYEKINEEGLKPEAVKTSDEEMALIYFKDIISKTIIDFYDELSEERKKLLAMNIFNKFLSNKKNVQSENAMLIFNLYQKYKMIRPFFEIWKNVLCKTCYINTSQKSEIKLYNSLCKNAMDLIDENNSKNFSTLNKNANFEIKNINFNNSATIPKNVYSKKESHVHTINNLNNSHHNNYTSENTSGSVMNNFSINNQNSFDYKRLNNTTYSKNTIDLYEKYLETKKPRKAARHGSSNLQNQQYLTNLSRSQKTHHLIPEKTTEYLREQAELRNNCTFTPKINDSYLNGNVSLTKTEMSKRAADVVNRLYRDEKSRVARREMEALARNNFEAKENTFQPKFISKSVNKVRRDFDQRCKTYTKQKEERLMRINKHIEAEFNERFTFTPKINLNQNLAKNFSEKKLRVPAHERLYNENKRKKQRQEERLKAQMDEIKFKANCPIQTLNSNYHSALNGNRIYNIYGTNRVDYAKIEELYNDYKKIKNKLKKKREDLEKEQGLTFRPEVFSGQKYYDRINQNFHEREKKFMEGKQNYIEAYKNFLENEQSKHKKVYTNQEKEEIINNLVNRLYKDGMEKYMAKKGNDKFEYDNNNEFNVDNNDVNYNEQLSYQNQGQYIQEEDDEQRSQMNFIRDKFNEGNDKVNEEEEITGSLNPELVSEEKK